MIHESWWVKLGATQYSEWQLPKDYGMITCHNMEPLYDDMIFSLSLYHENRYVAVLAFVEGLLLRTSMRAHPNEPNHEPYQG